MERPTLRMKEMIFRSATLPIVAPDPGKPTQAEIDEHRIDHAQYRSWCGHCVRGRGRGQPHKSSDSSKNVVPIFVFDHLFICKKESDNDILSREEYMSVPESEQDEVAMTVLVATCCKTKSEPNQTKVSLRNLTKHELKNATKLGKPCVVLQPTQHEHKSCITTDAANTNHWHDSLGKK